MMMMVDLYLLVKTINSLISYLLHLSLCGQHYWQ